MTTPLIIKSNTRTHVQVAHDWPTSDAGWTSIDAWAKSVTYGLNNDVGSAQLFTPSGVVFKPNANISTVIKSQNICGKYARVLLAKETGTIVVEGTNYRELWHGVVISRGMEQDGMSQSFVNTYSCAGILSVLDSVVPPWHVCEAQDDDFLAMTGVAPVFNYLGSKKTGNRSKYKATFAPGVTAYVFTRGADAEFWTAQDVIEYYLALFVYFGQSPLRFTLSGQLEALRWQEKWDTNGHSCGEAISRVMSQKQGIGYSCRVVDGQPVIQVRSMSQTPIVVPSTPFMPAGFTLPANDSQFSIDLTDPENIQDFKLVEDVTSVVDQFAVQTSKAWYVATLSLFDDFDQDWTEADKTAWDTVDPLDSHGTLNTIFGIARVFRRFKLKKTWNRSLVGGSKIPNSRLSATSSLHGVGGYTGAQVNDPLEPTPPGYSFIMTGELPCLDGYDWATVDPATVDKTRRNASAMAFIENGDGTWSTLADSGNMNTISLDVDGDLGAITFPEEAVQDIEAAINEGLKIYVVVGMYAQLDDTMSWKRDPAQRARDQVRSFTKTRSSLSRKIIPAHSVVGVNKDGSLIITGSSDIIIHDDTALAQSVLAISSPWFTRPTVSLTFSVRGVIDEEYASPGDMATSVDHLEGDGSTTHEDIVCVVTGVTLNLDEPGSTSITTKRVDIDVEPVL